MRRAFPRGAIPPAPRLLPRDLLVGLMVAALVLTGLFGVAAVAAATGRVLPQAGITVGAPVEKPCERGLRSTASLCQIPTAGQLADSIGGFVRVSEPVPPPSSPRAVARPGEWREAPPFRPPRASM